MEREEHDGVFDEDANCMDPGPLIFNYVDPLKSSKILQKLCVNVIYLHITLQVFKGVLN